MNEVVNITDVCKEIFAGGDAPKSHISKTKNAEFTIPIYSNGEENLGLYGYTDIARVQEPSITVSARGTIGYTVIRLEPFMPIVRLITLVPNTKLVDINYLYFAVQNYHFDGNGTSIPQLTVPMIKKYYFPLPSMSEQKKKAEALNEVCYLIELRKKQIEQLDSLVKSRFIEMFGDPVQNPMEWPIRTLSELSTKIANGTTPKGGSQVYVHNGVAFFRSQNVWRNRFEMDDIAYIDEKTHLSMKESSLRHGDILITKTGRINTENSSLGRVALYLGADDSANINGHIYLVRLHEGISRKFVLNILISDMYRDYIRSVCVGGIDKRQLNRNHIEEFPIIQPPVEMQDEFIRVVEQVDKSKMAIQKGLGELEILKKALMQQYFG